MGEGKRAMGLGRVLGKDVIAVVACILTAPVYITASRVEEGVAPCSSSLRRRVLLPLAKPF